MNKFNSGQAAILIIFVLGMIALLIGMSLSKTGFQESMMARSTAGSTKAFYIANSGIEDAMLKIKTLTEVNYPYNYELNVGDGQAVYRIEILSIETHESVITTKVKIVSTGIYENFIRKLEVVADNKMIQPDFTRFIKAGDGGIQMGQNVHIKSSEVGGSVDISSMSFILGSNNGDEKECTNASTEIIGNLYAYENIGRLNSNGSGPCVTGNAYAGKLEYCRIFGKVYSDEAPSVYCPYSENCDLESEPDCKRPDLDELNLPDIGADFIEGYLNQLEDSIWDRNCEIGGANDCSTRNDDGSSTIGNLIIEGNLETNSNSVLYLSGHVWVKGDVTFDSNQIIKIAPSYEDESSLIMLVDGKVNASANTHFYADEIDGISRFLLLTSKYPSDDLLEDGMCEGDLGDNAIEIDPNVQSILFYAMNGCAYVKATASEAFLGAILAKGVYIDNNVNIIYDPALKDAKFYLSGEDTWQISSFTEI